MASVVYNTFKESLLNNDIDVAADDIRVALLMTNTTADDSPDTIEFIDDIGTLDEYDGTNYARQALASEAVTKSDTTNRATFDAADFTINNLGAGTRDIAGALVFKFVTDDTDSPVICFVAAGSSVNGDGSNFTWVWHDDGIFYLT